MTRRTARKALVAVAALVVLLAGLSAHASTGEAARVAGFGPPQMPTIDEPRLARWIPTIHRAFESAWTACYFAGVADGFNVGLVCGVLLGMITAALITALLRRWSPPR